MSQWNQCRLIDILTNIDMTMLEDDALEADLENTEICVAEKERWSKKKIAIFTGIAGGCAVLTGAVVLLCKCHLVKKAA